MIGRRLTYLATDLVTDLARDVRYGTSSGRRLDGLSLRRYR
jgi:hypothetical protein